MKRPKSIKNSNYCSSKTSKVRINDSQHIEANNSNITEVDTHSKYKAYLHGRINSSHPSKLKKTGRSVNQFKHLQFGSLAASLQVSQVYCASDPKIQFIQTLYQKKAEDMKTIKNQKHSKNFMEKMKDKINNQAFMASECQFGVNSIKHISNYLPKTAIQKLILNNNPIGDKGIVSLSQILPQLQLKFLELISINLGPKGCKNLLESLVKCTNLQSINLSSTQGLNRNRFGKEAIPTLQQLFSNSNTQLKHFFIENSSIGEQGFNYICKGIHKNSKLQTLNVVGNQIKDLKLFYQKFRMISLAKLYLGNNSIGDAGLQILSTMLGTQYNKNSISKTLKYLNINNNKIKSFGLQIFSREMNYNQHLQQLIFDNNPLNQGERFFNFKYFLIRNWSLKKLSLRSTIESQDDFRNLREGLQRNKSIQLLDLSGNNLQMHCFYNIMLSLVQNKSIKTLLMENCNLSDKYLKHLLLIQQNKSLRQISFENNFIHDKGGYCIIQLLKISKRISKFNVKKNCIGPIVLKEISQLLKFIKQKSQKQQPDLSYFDFLEQIQNSQQSNLLKNIQKLRNKQEKEQLHQILWEIIDKDKKINQIKTSINQQKKKVYHLQNAFKEIGVKYKKAQNSFVTE